MMEEFRIMISGQKWACKMLWPGPCFTVPILHCPLRQPTSSLNTLKGNLPWVEP